MLILLINLALADCDPRLTLLNWDVVATTTPTFLVGDYRFNPDPTDLPVKLLTSDGQQVPLQATRSYCSPGTHTVYGFTPSEPLVAGDLYTFEITDAYTDPTSVSVELSDQSPPTSAPLLNLGERWPRPGEPASSLEENEFVWTVQEPLPTAYIEYQVADADGQVHMHSAAGGRWLDVGTNYCFNSWTGLTDDTVLFLRARYLNISGQTGAWSAWTTTENAPDDVTLPSSDATIDCGDPPEPPQPDTDTDTESDTETETETDDAAVVSPGCISVPVTPRPLLALLGVLAIIRTRRR